MSANCSNASFLPVFPCFFSDHFDAMLQECFSSEKAMFLVAGFSIINMVVIMPLYIYITYLGLQRWCCRRSTTPISHFDVFMYNIILIEKLNLVTSQLLLWGIYTVSLKMVYIAVYLSVFNITGENVFHFMTCMERCIAVTYPITYRNLRNKKGTRIRNIIIGCGWLLCFGCAIIFFLQSFYVAIIIYLIITVLILATVCFSSINVLCVLIRCQPVERGGHRQYVDQSKLKAFYTVTFILVVLIIRCASFLISAIVFLSYRPGETEGCVLMMVSLWLSLPSNMVQPLLYLQRAGKLPGFKCSTNAS